MNPGQLKLELLCRGVKIDDSIHVDEDARRIVRTRAGLGSGIEIILPDDLWVNVPVNEGFVKGTPYKLIKEGGNFYVAKGDEKLSRFKFAPDAKFHFEETSDGTPMRMIGTLQGGYLAIFPSPVCGFWKIGKNCRFCSTGLNVGKNEAAVKSVEQVREVVRAAFDEKLAQFVHLNIGLMGGEDRGIKFLEPYVKAIKEEADTFVGIQSTPPKDDKWVDYAYSYGVDSMSSNFEIYDPRLFAEICPGKHEMIGQKRFFDFMEYCAKVFPNGAAAGEIIAGLEPTQSTLDCIDYITGAGALPIVCVFRPLTGTALEDRPSPPVEDMAKVFAHTYEACKRDKVRMNLVDRVSIVMMPIEGRYLTENTKRGSVDALSQEFFRTSAGKWAFRRAAGLRRRLKK